MAPLDESNPKFRQVLKARERNAEAKRVREEAEADAEIARLDAESAALEAGAAGADESGAGQAAGGDGAGASDGGLGPILEGDGPVVSGNASNGIGTESTVVTGDVETAESKAPHAVTEQVTPSPAEVGLTPVNDAGTPDTIAPTTAEAVEDDNPGTPPTVTPASPDEEPAFEAGEPAETEADTDVDDDPTTPPTVGDPTLGWDGNPTLATVTHTDEDGPDSLTPTVARLERPENGRSKEKWFEYARSVDLSEGEAFKYEDRYEDVTKDALVREYGDR
jgi:hypothetical protein